MKLILTRKTSNPTCTVGELVSEDGKLRLVTKEGKIPRDRMGYIMWCLPPGTYELEVEYCSISYKDKPIRAYWPVFKKVGWFPHAGFYTGTMVAARKGRILLGTEQVDDYQISGDDEACQLLVRWSKTIYDGGNLGSQETRNLGSQETRNLGSQETRNLGSQETLTLEIVQDESSIVFSDVSEHDFRLAEERAKEIEEQEELKNELFG